MKLNIFSKKEEKKPKVKELAEDTAVQPVQSEPPVVAVANAIRGRSNILRIYTSEKSTHLIGMNQYVFVVQGNATKNEIKKEVGQRYGVKVKGVNILNVRGKERIVGRHVGFRSGFRKAVVTLQPGSVIQQARQ